MEKKRSLKERVEEILRPRGDGRVFTGVHLAVADRDHVTVLAGPPELLEALDGRLDNLAWWGVRRTPAEPGVWRCDLRVRDASHMTVDGTVHDEDWSVENAERVWAPPGP